MPLGRSVLWFLLVGLLVACSGAFGAGQSADAGGDDATEENPGITGTGGFADGGRGTPVDAGSHHDATAASDTGALPPTPEAGSEAGNVAETGTGDEPAPPGCATGDLACNGSCVPDDVHNCGTCGHDCTNLPHVSGTTTCDTSTGQCVFPASACAAGWAQCDSNPDDGCETDITKPATCGSCTNACPTNDPVCSGGTCVSGCPTATPTLCSGTCVDTTSNASDCNGCGLSCPNDVQNAQPTCANSKCSFTCNLGFSACPTGAPTACVDETSDPGNCGGCGKVCPGPTTGTGTAACAGSACTLQCAAGLTACPATPPATGIPTECVNTATDLHNCGSCLDVCTTTVSNASPTCANSMCGFACNSGYQLCGTNECVPLPNVGAGLFVSPGATGPACTETAPCGSIDTAVALAISGGNKTIIYLDKALYDSEQVTLPANAGNITIQGGWTYSAGGNWTTCNNGVASSSVISPPSGSSFGVSITGGTWTLDTLTIENNTTAAAGTATTPAQSLYGVHQSAGTVALTNVSITVAAGGAGASGAQGSAGTSAPASCTTAGDGATGGVGPLGAAGAPGVYGPTFVPGNGATASSGGASGDNGSGGTAGASTTNSCCNTAGDGCDACLTPWQAGAGTFGCGGGGGGPGSFGGGGGASIGFYAAGGTATLASTVSITTAAGGKGGDGGPGGVPAPGSSGAVGQSKSYPNSCSSTPAGCKAGVTCTGCGAKTTGTLAGGAAGSAGGSGGAGGQGGGGAGGDSICVASAGGTASGGTCTHGAGGAGGNQGLSNQGATGRAAATN